MQNMTASGCDLVRASAETISRAASHVHIRHRALEYVAASLDEETWNVVIRAAGWDRSMHFADTTRPELLLRYLLVLDSLNFCFWPLPHLEYDNLARGLKECVLEDPTVLSCEALRAATPETVQRMMQLDNTLPPLASERARFLREIPAGLEEFDGSLLSLVQEANSLAARLVELIVRCFPGFRDQSIYRGHQVFFYKRAQIFVADVWGAFGGKGPGAFVDIDSLTMFADYRVPAQLRSMDILEYTPELARKIDEREVIPAGSEDEVEIRACTIQAVELLKKQLQATFSGNSVFCSVALDWWLWTIGERNKDRQKPHHRTLTPHY